MFDNYFEVFLADTEESRNIHYSIRYQVYCEEMGFENKLDFPTEMEFDEDDAKSVHFIVRNKVTKDWIGAMRLINKKGGLLPIEQSCEIDEGISTNDIFKSVEISRLCLVKEVRKGNPPIGEMENIKRQQGDTPQVELNRLIIWGLFYAAVNYGRKNRISNSYFMTTKVLARVLTRAGLNLIKVGGSCQHKGERFPFKMNTEEVCKSDVWKNKCSYGYSLFSEIKSAKAA